MLKVLHGLWRPQLANQKTRVKKMSETEPGGTFFSEEDVLEGMRQLRAYIDLTPDDFKRLYDQVHQIARRRLFRETTAGDIMTRPAVVVGEDLSLEAAVSVLADHRISGAPVVDRDGRLCGVLSEKDILRALGEKPAAGLMDLVDHCLRLSFEFRTDPRADQVRDVMSRPPVAIGLEISLGDIMRIFEANSINRLPVTDASGAVLGIITRANVMAAVSRFGI